MHNGSRSTWTPPSFTGYPSTGFTAKKWKGIAYSMNSGNSDENWQSNPPASIFNVGYTSYSIHGGDDGNSGGGDGNNGDGSGSDNVRFVPPQSGNVSLGKSFFFRSDIILLAIYAPSMSELYT